MGASFGSLRKPENAQLRNPLPQNTGGLIVENTNFAMAGIGKLNNALKGYYLLSFSIRMGMSSSKANRRISISQASGI
jgi:hypothetical protein